MYEEEEEEKIHRSINPSNASITPMLQTKTPLFRAMDQTTDRPTDQPTNEPID